MSIVFSVLFEKTWLWLTFVTFSLLFNTLCPLIRCTLFQTSLSKVFLFYWLHFRHNMSLSFSPIQFPPCLPPSSHCCICWRFFFLVDINEWNLSYKVWNYLHLQVNSLESFTSQSFNYICQEKIIADDYASVNYKLRR